MSLYCLPLIRGRLPSLRPSNRRLRFHHGQSAVMVNMSSVELGSSAGVSESTVIKCKRLGFDSLSSLSWRWRAPGGRAYHCFRRGGAGDDAGVVIQKVFHANSVALSDTSGCSISTLSALP